MVKLSKLYTRQGDSGETGLVGGERVLKNDRQVEAYGNIDELNCWIGLVRASIRKSVARSFEKELQAIQQILFDLGAELATPKNSSWKPPSVVTSADVKTLEDAIDAWTGEVEELKSFLLPGGSELTSCIHIARGVCRRAERSIITLSEELQVRAEVKTFVNRLSDWLFALARVVAKEIGEEETLWNPSRESK